jgi:hypothetical protein
LGGHPLQSALWGQAKQAICGISDRRLALYLQGQLAALIRIENRGIPLLSQIAWVPQGPSIAAQFSWEDIEKTVLNYIRKKGYALAAMTPWISVNEPNLQQKTTIKTIWIDLQRGKETLWASLDKQWRYGVRSAQRANVEACIASSEKEVTDFYQLCVALKNKKTFEFSAPQSFLQYLLDRGNESAVDAKLFLAKYEGEIAAGAFILRAGKNIHYLYGAVDRQYAKQRVGEFVQWSVIEWACNNSYARYDLEGIDIDKNPSVAAFKKKMGGEVITLPTMQIADLNLRGKILSTIIRKKSQ